MNDPVSHPVPSVGAAPELSPDGAPSDDLRTACSGDLADLSDEGLDHERHYVAMLYGRLDERRADTARRLESVLHDETVGTPQALTEREMAAVATSEDAKEGPRAFAEKRAPQWQAR